MDAGAIRRMTAAIHHRGPDAEGFWSDPHCTLGHRRLAIIDLSESGRQPLSNEDGTVWITFNGEIYNFQQLRSRLESLGHRFRTRTDTETIVHAYEQWGTDCLKHLRGMFAFGVWDAPRRRLFLARDRVGKKPLFYSRSGDRLLFASELQGILADAEVSREVDHSAINAYLSWGYIPAPHTAFRPIRKLPPAHFLVLEETPAGWVEKVERYWRLDYAPKLKLDEREACEALREKLSEAVRLRMISDVPLGAFLSGGIDSSIIVGLMAQQSAQPVKTFSIGFNEAAWDETEHAERIARRWGTDHRKFIVEPNAIEVLPKLVRHYGEPYADSSAVPTFYVSQLTRNEVTVALNGDGGDESFAGYERYLGNRIASYIRGVPGSGAAARLLGSVIPDSLDSKSRLRRARRFLQVAAEPMDVRYGRWVGYFSGADKSEMYSREFRAGLNGSSPEGWMEEHFARAARLDPVEAAMAVDVETYLPYDLLVKVDITSMANSLEARSPFLDHEVMELAARLPVGMKLRGRESKYILKRAFGDLLPRENVERRKMGFGAPVSEWFRGEMKDLLRDALLSEQSRRRGYFDERAVRRRFGDHVERRADHGFALWNLLMLELWHREFID
ncbi:MAG: asparagine synthase (glutamine-hydrolyzing) [Blastocatellales bacterium]|nr:asparagine synthase (glutamine-hydrolyzing) [Blastocatellales bacterium]